MNRSRIVWSAITVALGALALAVNVSACGDRAPFSPPTGDILGDAATNADCLFQCSIDGRSVIQACTGVVQTCSDTEACGAGRCQEPCAAAVAAKSSNACDFYFQPPAIPSSTLYQSCYAAYVVNASNVPVDLRLEFGGADLDVSKSLLKTTAGSATLIPHSGSIAPGESVILFLSDLSPDTPIVDGPNRTKCPANAVPATFLSGVPKKTGIGTSFHLTTNVPVSLSTIYPFGGAASYVPSATLVLPVAMWGTQHIVVDAWDQASPVTQIVASEDATAVTLLPSHAVQRGDGVEGTAARLPVTYNLDKGQFLQFLQAEDLSGTVVMSDKPTSVFGGHSCMVIPVERAACDGALQQLPAVAQWGSEYVGVGYRPRLGNEHEPMPYRIVAARDGTRLDYDPAIPPGAPVTMSAGEVVTFWTGVSDAFVVRTQDEDHPIYLAAYMTGGGQQSSTGSMQDHGDPEFVNVIPAGQYLNSYSFYADPTYGDTSLVIVREKDHAQFKDVWLECAGGNLTDFHPVGTGGRYEYTRVDLAKGGGPGQAFGANVCQNGLQHLHSDGPFAATVWGWDFYASYAYPGGMAQRQLVKTPLPQIN